MRLRDDMTLARLMVYAKSIEETKHGRIVRNLKRSGSIDQGKPKFNKRAQTQEEPRSAKVILKKGGGSQNVKPTCVTCGKRDYGECLKGSGCFYGCGK